MHKKLLTIVSLLLSAGASAQVTLAPEAGFQMVNMLQKVDNSTSGSSGTIVLSPQYKPAFRGGLNIVTDINNISIHAGVFYAARGYRVSYMGDLMKANLNYVDVPVYVNYNIINKGGNKFFAGLGPYLSYCVGAKVTFESPGLDKEKYTLSIGSDPLYNDIKPIDIGANANLGFVSATGIYVRAHYSLGLTNTIPGGGSSASLKNTGFGISVGYQIRMPKNKQAAKVK